MQWDILGKILDLLKWLKDYLPGLGDVKKAVKEIEADVDELVLVLSKLQSDSLKLEERVTALEAKQASSGEEVVVKFEIKLPVAIALKLLEQK